MADGQVEVGNELKVEDLVAKLDLQLDLGPQPTLPSKAPRPAEGGVRVSERRGTGFPLCDPSRDECEW